MFLCQQIVFNFKKFFVQVLQNYAQLMEVWERCLDENLDAEVRGRIIGCKAQMETFKFFMVST